MTNRQAPSGGSHAQVHSARFARRDVLKMSLGVCGGMLALPSAEPVQAKDFSEPDPGANGLTGYQDNSQIFIRWNNIVVAAYRANATQKYPYFGSLLGPLSGSPVTTESSLPYPHHRGVWLGCDPLSGGDYWSDGPLHAGQIASASLSLNPPVGSSKSLTINNACNWVDGNSKSPCSDKRTMTFSIPSEHIRLLSIDVSLSAHEDIKIAKAKHSFFALRAAPDISPTGGGTLMNSAGKIGAEAIHGKPANWCGYHGSRQVRSDVVEGIAFMDHPSNPWNPCPWFVRDYGHLSPSPFSFLKKPWRLDRGQTIRLQYMAVIHAGTPKEAKLDDIFDRWVST
jgi:hypothetical protein